MHTINGNHKILSIHDFYCVLSCFLNQFAGSKIIENMVTKITVDSVEHNGVQSLIVHNRSSSVLSPKSNQRKKKWSPGPPREDSGLC